MKIGELAKQAGITVQAIRFYETEGLLPAAPRTASGYRSYRDSDLHRLRLIQQAKHLGFALEEIKRVLRLREQGSCPCTEVIATLERHLQETEAQIHSLQRFRRELRSTLSEWRSSGENSVPGEIICGLIERTMKKKGDKHGTTKR